MSKKIGIIYISIFLLLFGGCSNHRTKEQLVQEGIRQLTEQNSPNSAIILFKNALEKDQNYFEARFQLARAYMRVGKIDSAEKELQKVKLQNPASRDVQLELARVYLQQSKADEALREISAYIGDTSTDADALEISGAAYAINGDYNIAIAHLQKASANAANTTAAITLAKVYFKMGNVDAAKQELAALLGKDPSNKVGLYTLADLQIREKDSEGALKRFDQIIQYHPSDIEAYFKKGMLFVEKGDYEGALSLSGSMTEKFPKRPEGLRLKGITLFYKKSLGEAVVALQKSISVQPHVSSYYFLGLCHYYRNELEQAMSQLQKALDLQPGFTQARLLIGVILMKKNNYDDAIAEINKTLEGNANNALAHNILGSAYLAKGLHDKGMEELNRAIDIDPKLVDVHLKKGLFDLSRGNLRDAETDLKTAVQVAPDLLYSRALLASYYMKQNDFQKAITVLNEGLKGKPSDALFYNLIAEVMLRQNRTAEAEQYLQKAKELSPEYPNSYFNLAAISFQNGKQEQGIQELKTLIAKAPGNVRALLSLASLLETGGGNDEALKYYLQAKATGKVESFIALANYYMRKKETDKALQALDEGKKANPSDLSIPETRGKVFISQKRYDEALKVFSEIEQVNPKAALPYVINTYLAMKQPEKALARVQAEIKKYPDSAELMAESARISMMMGKHQEAVEKANEIIRKKPASPVGPLALAAIYHESKEPAKAIDVLKNVRIKDVAVLMMLGNMYAAKKEYISAIEQYRKAEEVKPGYVPALFQQASVLHVMGKRKEAIVSYQQVLRFAPNYVPALNNLAYLYADEPKELPAALQLATKAYTIAPNDGLVQDTLGFVLLKSGKISEGLSALKKAIELVPDNPSISYHLALAYKEQGDRVKSIEYLQKALRSGSFPEAQQAQLMLDRMKKG